MKHYTAAFFKIRDFQQFKAEFDSVLESLRNFGFARTFLNRDLDDPNHLIVVHEVEDLNKARDFYNSAQFKQCIQRAGVIGEPRILFMEELARTPTMVNV
jgi:uncharacterized protein (DUF1330 family)